MIEAAIKLQGMVLNLVLLIVSGLWAADAALLLQFSLGWASQRAPDPEHIPALHPTPASNAYRGLDPAELRGPWAEQLLDAHPGLSCSLSCCSSWPLRALQGVSCEPSSALWLSKPTLSLFSPRGIRSQDTGPKSRVLEALPVLCLLGLCSSFCL